MTPKPEPAPHPALAVIDNEIAALTESKCEHQREAAALDNRVIMLGALRAKVEKALGSKPAPVQKPPRAKRRTSAEMKAARDKTVLAITGAGLTGGGTYCVTSPEPGTGLPADREGKVTGPQGAESTTIQVLPSAYRLLV